MCFLSIFFQARKDWSCVRYAGNLVSWLLIRSKNKVIQLQKLLAFKSCQLTCHMTVISLAFLEQMGSAVVEMLILCWWKVLIDKAHTVKTNI